MQIECRIWSCLVDAIMFGAASVTRHFIGYGPVLHHAPFDLGQIVSSVTLWKVLHSQHRCTQLQILINVVTGKSQVSLHVHRCSHVCWYTHCHSLLYFHFHSFPFLLILLGQHLFDGLKITPSQTKIKSTYLN